MRGGRPDYHPLVGQAKDVAAGAVLISAIGAVLIGARVLVPHLGTLGAVRSDSPAGPATASVVPFAPR